MLTDILRTGLGSCCASERWRHQYIALLPGGKMAYTANGPSNDVSLVDLTTKQVVKKIAAGTRPWGVAIISQ